MPFRAEWPASHLGAESIHDAWLDTTTLPRTRSDEYRKLVDRWKAAGEEPPGTPSPRL